MDKRLDLGGLTANLTDVRLPVGLVLDSLELQTGAAKLEADPWKLALAQDGKVRARVSAANVAAYLESLRPGGLSEFRVALSDGLATIDAKARMIVEIPARAVCRLVIVEGRRLEVELVDVDVLGVAAEGLVRNQLDKVNPILDVKDFPIPMRLEKVTLTDGSVWLDGSVPSGQMDF